MSRKRPRGQENMSSNIRMSPEDREEALLEYQLAELNEINNNIRYRAAIAKKMRTAKREWEFYRKSKSKKLTRRHTI